MVTGSFQTALSGTSVQDKYNASSTRKVEIVVSPPRQACTELKVAHVPPSFGIISDNFKTWCGYDEYPRRS